MFSRSFLLQSSWFFRSYFQGENADFHLDRAPHRDSDHRDSRSDADACIGKSEGERKKDTVRQSV